MLNFRPVYRNDTNVDKSEVNMSFPNNINQPNIPINQPSIPINQPNIPINQSQEHRLSTVSANPANPINQQQEPNVPINQLQESNISNNDIQEMKLQFQTLLQSQVTLLKEVKQIAINQKELRMELTNMKEQVLENSKLSAQNAQHIVSHITTELKSINDQFLTIKDNIPTLSTVNNLLITMQDSISHIATKIDSTNDIKKSLVEVQTKICTKITGSENLLRKNIQTNFDSLSRFQAQIRDNILDKMAKKKSSSSTGNIVGDLLNNIVRGSSSELVSLGRGFIKETGDVEALAKFDESIKKIDELDYNSTKNPVDTIIIIDENASNILQLSGSESFETIVTEAKNSGLSVVELEPHEIPLSQAQRTGQVQTTGQVQRTGQVHIEVVEDNNLLLSQENKLEKDINATPTTVANNDVNTTTVANNNVNTSTIGINSDQSSIANIDESITNTLNSHPDPEIDMESFLIDNSHEDKQENNIDNDLDPDSTEEIVELQQVDNTIEKNINNINKNTSGSIIDDMSDFY